MKTNIKLLKEEDGRAEYYRYYMDDPNSWIEKPAPTLLITPIDQINKELEKIAGVDHHGDPRFRAVWAGTLKEIKFWEDFGGKTHEIIGKKYCERRMRRNTGWSFIGNDGKKRTVTNQRFVPQGKAAGPESEVIEFGELKWVVEMKFTAEEMVNAGYLPAPGSEREKTFCIRNGQRYRKTFDRRGEYMFCFYCQDTVMGGEGDPVVQLYRDITLRDVENTRAIWNMAHSESESEFAARVIASTERILSIKEQRAAEEQSKAIRNAADRAEKLPVGQLIFT